MKPISASSYPFPSSPETPITSPNSQKLTYTSASPILGPIEEKLAAENELGCHESRTNSIFTRFRQASDANLSNQRHTHTYLSLEAAHPRSSYSSEYDEANELERLPPPMIPLHFKDRLNTSFSPEDLLFSECPEPGLSTSYIEYRNRNFLNFKKTIHEILSKTKNNEKTQEIPEEEKCLLILEQDCSETFENQKDMIEYILDMAPQYSDLFLFAASTNNYSEGVEILIRGCGVNPNTQNEAGDTPLHIAIESGALMSVLTLLEYGANPNLPNEAGITPMEQAQSSKNFDIQDALSRERSCSDRFAAFKIEIQNALGGTENDEKIKSILNKDLADDDVYAHVEMIKEIAKVSHHYAPLLLFAAAQADYAEGIEPIIYNLNVDINTMDALGNTALHAAVAFCSIKTIEILLKCGACFLQTNIYGQSPIDLVEEIDRTSIWGIFSEAALYKDEFGNNFLHNAAKYNHVENIKKLLMLGVDVDEKNIYGDTPLHLAVKSNSIETIEKLLTFEVDVDAQNRSGDTPLHLAVKSRSPDIIAILLKRGASKDIRDNAGSSPYEFAQLQDDDDVFDAFFGN